MPTTTVSDILSEAMATFVIPSTSGDYATQKVTVTNAATPTLALSNCRLLIDQALPAGATIEAWFLKTGGNPAIDGDYSFAATLSLTTNRSATVTSFSRAVQFRAKSGGTAGSVTGHATAV